MFTPESGVLRDRPRPRFALTLDALADHFLERGLVQVAQALEPHATPAYIGFRERLLVALGNICLPVGRAQVQGYVGGVAGHADPKPIGLTPTSVLQLTATVGEHAGLNERLKFCGLPDQLVERGDVGFARFCEFREVLRGRCNLELAFQRPQNNYRFYHGKGPPPLPALWVFVLRGPV